MPVRLCMASIGLMMMAATGQRTIVVGTDGSKTAERAVREAAGLARATGARLVLVSAFSDLHPYRERTGTSAREGLNDLEKVSDQVLQRALSVIDDGSDVETVSREGDPAEVLADVAQVQGAQTIVIGDAGSPP
jgi:nucleotide-binding universal stress UspA family protein